MIVVFASPLYSSIALPHEYPSINTLAYFQRILVTSYNSQALLGMACKGFGMYEIEQELIWIALVCAIIAA
jgi:hypothetical protein